MEPRRDLSPMRLVLDTNVLVSALLNPGRTPGRALDAVRAGGAIVLVDHRVEAEYRTVLARPKFGAIDHGARDALLDGLLGSCVRVVAAPSAAALIDDDDRAFVEVALAGGADAVVTGNTKHYPTTLGFAVWSPAELLARLGY